MKDDHTPQHTPDKEKEKAYQDKLNEKSHGDQYTTHPGGRVDIGVTGGVTQSDNRDKETGNASNKGDRDQSSDSDRH